MGPFNRNIDLYPSLLWAVIGYGGEDIVEKLKCFVILTSQFQSGTHDICSVLR
jgi:hypothetical protein